MQKKPMAFEVTEE